MPLFEVELDGSETGEHERTSTITVDAADEASAKTFAEDHNPGIKAVSAKSVSS